MRDAAPADRPSRVESPLRADLGRTYAMTSGSALKRVLDCARAPGVQAVLVLRYGQWAGRRPKILRVLLDPVYLVLNLLIQVMWGIEIARGAKIGPGLYIGHFGGITVSSLAVIGRDCNLSPGNTIGVSGAGANAGAPIIGDNVYIGPGARVFGKITIGNNVKIGANAVIHEDLPDNAVAVLEPGFKIISHAGRPTRNPGEASD